MAKRRASKAKGKLLGLHARSFPKNLRDRVDQDYTHKLSPEEKVWLAEFNDRYYGADFRSDTDGEWDAEQRKTAYRAKNYVNRDAYSIALGGDVLDFPEVPEELEIESKADFSPGPKHLESPEYKAALHWYRQHISNKTQDTPQGRAARWRLEKSIHEEDE